MVDAPAPRVRRPRRRRTTDAHIYVAPPQAQPAPGDPDQVPQPDDQPAQPQQVVPPPAADVEVPVEQQAIPTEEVLEPNQAQAANVSDLALELDDMVLDQTIQQQPIEQLPDIAQLNIDAQQRADRETLGQHVPESVARRGSSIGQQTRRESALSLPRASASAAADISLIQRVEPPGRQMPPPPVRPPSSLYSSLI